MNAESHEIKTMKICQNSFSMWGWVARVAFINVPLLIDMNILIYIILCLFLQLRFILQNGKTKGEQGRCYFHIRNESMKWYRHHESIPTK